jgi:preprotein translocase subunit YajC
MNVSISFLMVAEAAPVSGPAGAAGDPMGLRMLIPMGIMVCIFYFVLIRPQQKKAKEHERLLKTLKSGDRVATNSGILGVVVAVKDKSVTLRSADTKLEIQKASVAEILERTGEATDK